MRCGWVKSAHLATVNRLDQRHQHVGIRRPASQQLPPRACQWIGLASVGAIAIPRAPSVDHARDGMLGKCCDLDAARRHGGGGYAPATAATMAGYFAARMRPGWRSVSHASTDAKVTSVWIEVEP